jgi:hypothetical protein
VCHAKSKIKSGVTQRHKVRKEDQELRSARAFVEKTIYGWVEREFYELFD